MTVTHAHHAMKTGNLIISRWGCLLPGLFGLASFFLIRNSAKEHGDQAIYLAAKDSAAAIVACQDTTKLPATQLQDIGSSRMHVILETPTRRADCYFQYGRITGVFVRRKVAH